jgi:hypothetical protein
MSFREDRLLLMGWPASSLELAGLSTAQMESLTGEGVHVGSMALVLYLVTLSEHAPWWDEQSDSQAPSSPARLNTPADVGPQRKKARRIGAIALRREAST